MRIFMKLNIIFITIILTGCNKNMPTNNKTSQAIKTISYTPVDKELLKNIKPYSKKSKPTLKEQIKLQQEQECLDRIKKSYKHPLHTEEPSIFQQMIDSYSCS